MWENLQWYKMSKVYGLLVCSIAITRTRPGAFAALCLLKVEAVLLMPMCASWLS
jgi:hypothetical protein